MPISQQDAVDIARKAVEGKARIEESSTVERVGSEFVVTFLPTSIAAKRRADYHAQVRVNSETGAVVNILVGP